MNEEAKKKVDESWKNQVEKERKQAQDNKEIYHDPSFKIFISSLSMQAMIALGKIDNPVTNKKEKNMQQARYLIDTLSILSSKTNGNLTQEEKALIDDSLFNLRIMYVEGKENND